MGKYFDVEQFDSANLLDPEERSHFNEGFALYYQHIANLYDKAGLQSYVADFATLGLNAIALLKIEEPVCCRLAQFCDKGLTQRRRITDYDPTCSQGCSPPPYKLCASRPRARLLDNTPTKLCKFSPLTQLAP